MSVVSPNDLALGICYLYFEVNPSESSKLEMVVIPKKRIKLKLLDSMHRIQMCVIASVVKTHQHVL